MRYLLNIITYFILFSSCSSPNEDSFEFDLSLVFNQINFEQPSVGQVSKYIWFRGANFGASNSSINYSGDTLLVTLTSKTGSNYTFQERLTSGSTVNSVTDPYINGHDLLKISEWEVIGDSLKYFSGETFLYWNKNQAIPLITDSETTNISLRNWGPNISTNLESNYNVNTGRINDFNFDDLTVSYLNPTPGASDGNLYEVICNKPFGIVRSSRFSTDDLSGSGWDLQLSD